MNKLLLKKIKIISTVIFLAGLILAYFNYDFVKEKCNAFFNKQLVKNEIVLKKVVISGVKIFDQKIIKNLFNKDINKNIFEIDLKDKLNSILKISWVRNVSIQRILPDKIVIDVDERFPIAYWQNNHVVKLIDIDGVVLESKIKFNDLILVIGECANEHAFELVRLLKKYHDVKISYAVFVGCRRWDLVTDSGILIKMPDNHLEDAFLNLTQIIKSDKVLDDNIALIDLRLRDKVIVKRKKIINNKTEI